MRRPIDSTAFQHQDPQFTTAKQLHLPSHRHGLIAKQIQAAAVLPRPGTQMRTARWCFRLGWAMAPWLDIQRFFACSWICPHSAGSAPESFSLRLPFSKAEAAAAFAAEAAANGPSGPSAAPTGTSSCALQGTALSAIRSFTAPEVSR